ncbi:MAG: NAD(P)-binding domain-containing protein [Hyphomicrobium sp.]|uniref:NAD(P)-binding domain-containing protein n=1 Tax=Hyphomicrobium sp. TaxID=82 RepID=UPI0039E60C93
MGTASIRRPIGIIGNDEFGPAIAERIAACNLPAQYAAPIEISATRTSPESSTEGDFSDCPVILVAIEDTETFRALLDGRTRVNFTPTSGTVLVDLGARTPREFDALLELVEPRGIALTDAALIGGPEAAIEGRAKVLLGGNEAAVEVAASVISLLGGVERTGPLGSAHAAAALMGYVEAAHAVAREEAMALGAACGLTPDMISRVLSERSPPFGMNVVQLARRADLARRLARDQNPGAEIVDLAAEKLARSQRENR